MIKAGIIGATGYAGGELVRLLLGHKEVEIVWYGSRSYVDEKYAHVYRNMFDVVDATCLDDNLQELARQVDVIFTATPQGYLASILTEEILSQVKIIEEAVYGLCEINRDKMQGVRLVANPGCYTTCSILTTYPFVKEGLIDHHTLIVDAKSGTSGAGRGAKVQNLFCEVNENMKAYGVATHRHTPEIEEQLGYACGEDVTISFTPHLVPMNRGILVTAYASLKKVAYPDGHVDYPTEDMLLDVYHKYYDKEYFVRVLEAGMTPETKWVEGSNFVDVCLKVDPRTHRVILMGALDNLVKGAAGQAVQNMNLLFGFKEQEGLELVPMFP